MVELGGSHRLERRYFWSTDQIGRSRSIGDQVFEEPQLKSINIQCYKKNQPPLALTAHNDYPTINGVPDVS